MKTTITVVPTEDIGYACTLEIKTEIDCMVLNGNLRMTQKEVNEFINQLKPFSEVKDG